MKNLVNITEFMISRFIFGKNEKEIFGSYFLSSISYEIFKDEFIIFNIKIKSDNAMRILVQYSYGFYVIVSFQIRFYI